MLLRRIINIYSDLARKHGNVAVKDYRKYEKPEFEKNKLKLDIDFLNNYKQLGVYPKSLKCRILHLITTHLVIDFIITT